MPHSPGKPNRAWEAKESKETAGSLNVDVPPPTKPNDTTDTKQKPKDER